MKNYVKGEWRLNNYHYPYQYIVAHGGPGDDDAFPGQRKICDIWDWDTERGKINAHLIVSAPTLKQQRDDLLVVCKTAEIELEQRYKAQNGSAVDKAALKIIKAAIAKCEA